ncbi:MAG: cation diffusion facilitator family transporter [Candidatus Nanohalobium sp.]
MHGNEEEHSHGGEDTSTRKLGLVSGINLAGFFVELAGGLMFGSIALISDAFHMLFDALAYVIAFGSAYLAERRSGDESWSFGLHRFETFAALFNGALLIPMAFYILWESYKRFLNPVDIGLLPTLGVGFLGLLVNLFSVYYLRGDGMSLNEKGAFYHLLGDAGGSVAVIVSTLLIYFTGFRAADPIAAVLIAGIIVWSASKVLRGSSNILLQRNPLDAEKVIGELEGLDRVEEVEDFRAWNLCSQITVVSAHISHEASDLENVEEILEQARQKLADAGADYITIEPERKGDHRHDIGH